MKTAAVYIRVSTDEQAEYSPDSQLAEAKAYAARNGMIISPDHVYTDVGISGRKANKRPAFMRMVAEAKGKPSPFDVILVWKFSRFARNQEESILYKNLLKKECNVEVVSISEEVGDSVFGSLIERIIERRPHPQREPRITSFHLAPNAHGLGLLAKRLFFSLILYLEQQTLLL